MGVACGLGYPCAKFRLPRPFGFRVKADVRDIRQTDRQTDRRTTDADHRIMPPRRGHKKWNVIEHCRAGSRVAKIALCVVVLAISM